MKHKLGFTLIEILVAVLIIGILGAIMLPQYQRAVLKSRFAALMPIAKSMADSNEAFYLEHGIYADNAEDLPVQGRRNYTDGTELEFGTLTGYSYVLATRDNNFPNNYVVYQKHSENFPGEIHCEANANNTQAQEVCKSFGPTQELGETLTSGYLTYVLFGTGNGEAPTGDEGGDEPEELQTPQCEGDQPADITLSESGATGTATCVNGQWKYQWTGAREIGAHVGCYGGNPNNHCAGAIYGEHSSCNGSASKGCAGSIFSGKESICFGYTNNASKGSIFIGEQSYCSGNTSGGCAGAIILAGAFCNTNASRACDEAKYGEDPTGQHSGLGVCLDNGYCPKGVPARGSWNETNGSYDISGWTGGYCNPNMMASGKCPAGSPTNVSNKTTSAGWNGGYCTKAMYGQNCPNNSPTETAGQCWDGSGGTKAC